MRKRIDREKVKELVEKGYSDHKIARMLGCDPLTVFKIRTTELGIWKNERRATKKEKIIKLLKEGKKYSEIARETGSSYFYVRQVAISTGIRKPRAKPIMYGMSLKMLKLVMERPRTKAELIENGVLQPRMAYQTLRNHGFNIRTFALTRLSRSATMRKHKNLGNVFKSERGDLTFYFMPEHAMQVYEMIKEKLGDAFEKLNIKRSVLKALGIKYVKKNDQYFDEHGVRI